eukprot:1081454-Pleurochrysis_carterae.AAC.1
MAMSALRLCLGATQTYREIQSRLSAGLLVDGRPLCQFARQNCGGITLLNFDLTLACNACLPFSPRVGSYGSVD